MLIDDYNIETIQDIFDYHLDSIEWVPAQAVLMLNSSSIDLTLADGAVLMSCDISHLEEDEVIEWYADIANAFLQDSLYKTVRIMRSHAGQLKLLV